jgi:hypothetical protein
MISGGRSLLTGHVSHANDAATALGVRPGQTGDEAALDLIEIDDGKASLTKHRTEFARASMTERTNIFSRPPLRPSDHPTRR